MSWADVGVLLMFAAPPGDGYVPASVRRDRREEQPGNQGEQSRSIP